MVTFLKKCANMNLMPSLRQSITHAQPSCSGALRLCAQDDNCEAEGSRQPLYCLEFFKTQLRIDQWQLFNERRASENMDKLDWSFHDLKKMLLGMRTFCFQKTVPNCTVNDLYGYETLDSDQYCVYWDEETSQCTRDYSSATVSLSLKIAVIEDDEGSLSGVVTFHLSN